MKSWISLAATVALVAPLAAFAQSTSAPSASGVQPADAPRSQLEKDQTQNNGQATKYGAPDSGASSATKSKRATKSDMKAAPTPSDSADSPSAATPTTSASPQTPTAKNPGK